MDGLPIVIGVVGDDKHLVACCGKMTTIGDEQKYS